MTKIFTDFHHAGLLQSLILLFEKRLGGEVYRPIGKEWFTNGFWKVYDHPATVEQFLGIGGATPDNSPKLNEVIKQHLEPKDATIVYHCQDIDSGETNKAITLQGFMAMDFDIVIASLPYHIEPFKKLCELHPNKPKLIYQIGNAWTIEAGMAPNVMASAIINDVPPDINFISYHQEFDTNLFCPTTAVPQNRIYSFVNCFSTQDHFKGDWQLFEDVERAMTEWEFKSYGGSCRDGACHGAKQVASEMQQAKFIWHTKAGGDGYGHVVFNSAAVGKPMITKKSYYAGKLGEKLMVDGLTCLDIDGLNVNEIVQKVEFYSEPTRYANMCEMVYNNFRKHVDFEKEAEAIKSFISNLK
jgi:hypothetical protein